MTEWEVVGVIVVLIGLGVSVVTPLMKLNSAITMLTQAASKIEEELKSLTERNSKTHARLFEAIEAEDEKVQDHEKRITVLEHDKS